MITTSYKAYRTPPSTLRLRREKRSHLIWSLQSHMSRKSLLLVLSLGLALLSPFVVLTQKSAATAGTDKLLQIFSGDATPNHALPSHLAHGSQAPTSSPKLEGCVSCHGQIEPMHKYGTTDTLEKLKDGKDAVGLGCTACHGGNPLPGKTSDDPKEIVRVKKQAHVQAP